VSAQRIPQAGDIWRSRDPRDDGLLVTVLDVWADSSHKWVRIQRFRKTNVSLRRFHSDYVFVRGGAA
jgi:hypothetical protein